MSIGVPSRYTEMNPQQERAGWEITMQGWDEALWLASCADEAALKKHVADPARFVERRSQTVVVLSNQVPFWLKLGNRKVVFSEADKSKRSKKSFERSHASMNAQQSQALHAVAAVEDALADEGQSQTRGPQKSGDDKYRVTIELRQAVLGLFGDGDPEGVGRGAHVEADPADLVPASGLVPS